MKLFQKNKVFRIYNIFYHLTTMYICNYLLFNRQRPVNSGYSMVVYRPPIEKVSYLIHPYFEIISGISPRKN